MIEDSTSSARFADLDEAGQEAIRAIMDAVVEGLHEYARMMDAGEMELMPGPDALRHVAGLFNVAMIQQEASASGN